MAFRFTLFFITLGLGICINWKKIQKFPPPQKNFDVRKFVGNWYIVARRPPCSFAGSADFTNSVTQYTLQHNGVLEQKVVFRSTTCTTIGLTKTPRNTYGIYEAKDSIGNVLSGTVVIIATDYKRFAIQWGCTKVTGSVCQDVSLYVKARSKKPSAKTWKTIQAVLQSYFDISLDEMIRVIHDDNACVTFGEKHRYSSTLYQSSADRLKKLYKR